MKARFHPANLLLFLPAALCAFVVRRMEFLWLEMMLLAAIVVAAAIAGKRLTWSAKPPGWCGGLRRASRRTAVACLLPAVASVVLRLALLPWIPVPNPVVPDEFSHILLAKTFLMGRLANPAHPLWQHFESIHILSQPTYSSMYMAGQACFLALGQLLLGNLFVGVILSTALFCAALTWFMRAYVPPGWALFGGMLAAVRIGAASYWNNSYWGGSAGALGGAMVLGAYPRLIRGWKPVPALVFATGLVLLANTRPYEGAVLGLVMTLALIREVWQASKRGGVARESEIGIVAVGVRQMRYDGGTPATAVLELPAIGNVNPVLRREQPMPWMRFAVCVGIAAVVLGASGWAMTRQWKAVTGHALTLPYQLNQRTYGWPLTLPWIPVREVHYRHPEFALYHDFEVGEHREVTEIPQMPIGLFKKYLLLWSFFFGITLCAVFPFTSRILSARRTRVVWIAGGVVALAVLTEQSGYPHYWSPIAPAILLFIVEGLRHLAQCRTGAARVGPAIVRSVLPVFCILLAARAATPPSASQLSSAPNFLSWCCTNAAVKDREPLVRQLEAIPGKHLVIVSYDLKTYDTFEWVYNEPDIDGARIVFARDMGAEKNQELIRYYPDRRVWRVVVEKDKVAALEPVLRP